MKGIEIYIYIYIYMCVHKIYFTFVGVDIGIRHPPREDDTIHKLIGRLKLPTYLITSLFFFLQYMPYNSKDELKFLKAFKIIFFSPSNSEKA